MGFFGHLVVSRTNASALWPNTEPEPDAWAEGLRVLRVFERLGGEWETIQDFRDRLAEQVPGGFLGASIWDSDGAFLVIGVPGQAVGRYWISIDGVLAHFVPPWAPFDEDGNRLTPEAEAAQDAEWEAEAAAYREQLLQLALPAEQAAALCTEWARYNNLTPGSISDVRDVLGANNTFVEDTFYDLLAVLGVRAPHSQ